MLKESFPNRSPEVSKERFNPKNEAAREAGLLRGFRGKAARIGRLFAILTGVGVGTGGQDKPEEQVASYRAEASVAVTAAAVVENTSSRVNALEGGRVSERVKEFTIYASVDGKWEALSIEPARLTERINEQINGYVAGFRIISTVPLRINVNHSELPGFQDPNTGDFVYKHGSLDSGSYIGNPGLEQESTSITLDTGTESVSVGLEQRPLDNIGTFYYQHGMLDGGAERTDTVQALYLGSNSETVRSMEGLEERLGDFMSGAYYVESVFNYNVADSVLVTEFAVSSVGAYVMFNRPRTLSIPYESLASKTSQDLKKLGIHESIHQYLNLRGYDEDRSLRSIFADISGFHGASRDSVIEYGGVPFDKFNPESLKRITLWFLNGQAAGNHSQDGIREFSQSVVQYLITSGRYGSNYIELDLEKPITVQTGSPDSPVYEQFTLDTEGKIEVLNNLITTTERLLAFSQENGLKDDEHRFASGLLELNKARDSLLIAERH